MLDRRKFLTASAALVAAPALARAAPEAGAWEITSVDAAATSGFLTVGDVVVINGTMRTVTGVFNHSVEPAVISIDYYWQRPHA